MLVRLLRGIALASIASAAHGIVLASELPALENGVEKRQAMPRPNQLVDFEVYEPVIVPNGTSNQYGCIHTQTLMEHVFGNSYGAPFVGTYTPPPCDFNRVVINLTVTSAGVQYDRLGLMYLGDTEVFRTSTAEPTNNGIIWTYLKEMQHYNALWKTPQKIIFDLGNLQNDQYTGAYETTLTATFFTIPNSPPTADQVLPISSRSSGSNMGSAWQVPSSNASVQYTLPKDVTQAVVTLSACGQSEEEFWYSNTPNPYVNTFESTTGSLLGGGVFREVQLLIDGRLSGVSWPFPVIFTGGIVPGFWRPIVGIDAFDLKQREIDITPWLGYLLDGKNHTFEIRVASVTEDSTGKSILASTPESYWLVSGSLFLFRDPKGRATTGSQPKISAPQISLSVSGSTTKDSSGNNNTLTYTTKASRSFQVSSTIKTGNGTQKTVSWGQTLSFSNYNHLTCYGLVQLTQQSTKGQDLSGASDGVHPNVNPTYSQSYSFPLTVNSSYSLTSTGSLSSLQGSLSRGKQLLTLGNSVLPTGLQNLNSNNVPAGQYIYSLPTNNTIYGLPADAGQYLQAPGGQAVALNVSQVASAGLIYGASGAVSYGTTDEILTFGGGGSNGAGDVSTEFYSAHVKAVNSTVVRNNQTYLGQTFNGPQQGTNAGANAVPAPGSDVGGVRQYLGRGPGKAQGLNSKGGSP